MATEPDLQRVKAQIRATEAIVPGLRADQLQHQLAVLLGRSPGDAVQVRALDATRAPAELPGGVPSGLLRRRPDIRAQEERLRAAAARVGVARALYFPQFTLNLSAGALSDTLARLFLPESFALDLLAAAAVPLFRGGELEANFNANVAACKQEVAVYQQTALVAFQETRDAISQVQEPIHRRDRLRQAVDDEQRARALAVRSDEASASSYLDVLDAQRSLLVAPEALIVVEWRRLVAMISLDKSLGGGWA